MKGTTKLIVSFGVAIAIVAAILVVAIFNDGGEEKEKSKYQLQSTTAPVVAGSQNTDSWINVDDLANDLVTATDPTEAPQTTILPDGSVVVLTTGPNVSYIYVGPDGFVVDASNVSNPITQAPSTDPIVTVPPTQVETDTVPDDNNQGDIEFSPYEVDSRTGYITKYNGDGGSLTLPEVVNGVKIKGIANAAFKGKAVTNVFLPACYIYIGDSAFQNCTELTSITFSNSNSSVYIGNYAFSGCLRLKNVTLPKSQRIGQCAFENCTSLTSVKIPEGSLEIGNYCFFNCVALKSVYMPESIAKEKIGEGIYKNCNPAELTVYCPIGSDAEQAAINAGVNTAPDR
jgi:hypothetical protein